MKNVWVRECWGIYMGKGLTRIQRVDMKNIWVRECWGIYMGEFWMETSAYKTQKTG